MSYTSDDPPFPTQDSRTRNKQNGKTQRVRKSHLDSPETHFNMIMTTQQTQAAQVDWHNTGFQT